VQCLKLVEYGFGWSCVFVFMISTVVVGMVWEFRRNKKHDFDLPMFVIAPIAWLWFVGVVAGVATVILGPLVPVIRWLH
jgi:hypothetical protein